MPQTFFINGRHMSMGEARKWRAEQDKLKKEELKEVKEIKVVFKEESKELDAKEDNELEALRKEFEKKEGKPVPNNKKNDAEWIKEKLNSSK